MKRSELKVGDRVVVECAGEAHTGSVSSRGRKFVLSYSGYPYPIDLRYMTKHERYQGSHGGTNRVYGPPVIVQRVCK